jgi:hypothetical protein
MFDFSFESKITKELLLSAHNEETYMSYYLGIPVKKGLFRSPLRADAHNTCSYFRGKSGILYFKDFATGQCLDFVNVVMTKYACSYYKALDIIAGDFGLTKKSDKKPIVIKSQPKFEEEKQTFIQCETKPFSEGELKWWGSYGISQKILSKFHVFSCKTVFLNGVVFAQSSANFPIFGYYFGKKENVEQWRIYMPKSKNTRFLGNVSHKTIQGYKQVIDKGKLLVITKSMKDVMCLYSIGIPAIAPNSETQFVEPKMLEELKTRFTNIALLFDTDLTGVRFMNKIRKQYPELIITLIPRKYKAKDISDFYKLYGKDKTVKLIKNTIIKWQKSRQILV